MASFLPESIRPFLAGLSVLGVCAGLYAFVPAPLKNVEDAPALAKGFSFRAVPVPGLPVPAGISHEVNPHAAHLRFYLYAVGTSAAFVDLDGDTLPNDLCLTDVRSKSVRIGPVPGTGDRYPAFSAELGPDVDLNRGGPTVCRALDANEDGLQDLLVAFVGRGPMLLLRRAPEPTEAGPGVLGAPDRSSFRAVELLPEPVVWSSLTATVVDVDGDGHLDIIVGNYFADGARIQDPTATEPFEMNDSFTTARNGGTNHLLLFKSATSGPEPTATFVDAGDVFPGDSERGWTLAMGAADLDRDGRPDLYVSNDFGPDTLMMNRSEPGAVKLVEIKGAPGIATPLSFRIGNDSFKGMGIDFADLNEDGIFDMYVSNIAAPRAMRESHFLWMSTGDLSSIEDGVAPWVNKSEALGVAFNSWGWESRAEDFNNDGVSELVQATGIFKGDPNIIGWGDLAQLGTINDEAVKNLNAWPSFPEGTDVEGRELQPFFVRGEDGIYVDVSAALYPELTHNTRGIPTGDIDGDGDIDMMFAAHWEDSVVLINESPNPGVFLGMNLLLPVGEPTMGLSVRSGHPNPGEGSPAVNALVELTTADGKKLLRQVDGGNGHSGSRTTQVIYGLGDADPNVPLDVHITWRDRAGRVHQTNTRLTPGWHTLTLGPTAVGANP